MEKDSPVLEEEEGPENERELEALAIAGKIRSMVGTEKVLDKETGEYRAPAIWRYCDTASFCHRLG